MCPQPQIVKDARTQTTVSMKQIIVSSTPRDLYNKRQTMK